MYISNLMFICQQLIQGKQAASFFFNIEDSKEVQGRVGLNGNESTILIF